MEKLIHESKLPEIEVKDKQTAAEIIERKFKLEKIREIDNALRDLRKDSNHPELSYDEFEVLLDQSNADLDITLADILEKLRIANNIEIEIKK